MFQNVDEARGALVDALLSGKYTKGRFSLCRRTNEGLTHCAQGVAVEVLRDNGYEVSEWSPIYPGGESDQLAEIMGTDVEGVVLPSAALRVFGLTYRGAGAIMSDNDMFGLSFEDIARKLKSGDYDPTP